MNLLKNFEKQSQAFLLVVGFVLIGVIGIIDFLTGYELAFSLFYVIPISLVTWCTSLRLGLVTSLVSALVWLSADITSGHTFTTSIIPIWNTFIRVSFFVIITWILSLLRSAIERERKQANIDKSTHFLYQWAQEKEGP